MIVPSAQLIDCFSHVLLIASVTRDALLAFLDEVGLFVFLDEVITWEWAT